jgi:outer membrane receptor for Fe3+-dicitrate
MQLAAYRQENTEEIGYIAANGKNANLDPTRRHGVEWEGKLRVGQAVSLRASLTRQSARFSEGSFSGKTIPLVSTHKESAGATWQGGLFGTHTVNAVRNGSRYFGGDFANAGGKLPAYTVADYQGEWAAGKVALGLRVNNLTNKKYSASGFSSTYYPADPRTVFVSGKVAFF